MRKVRLAIVGLGNVGRRLLELIDLKRALLASRYNLDLVVVGVADSRGGAVGVRGLKIDQILELKRAKKGVGEYPRAGRPGLTPLELVGATQADIVVELSLTNLKDGEPGLSVIRAALNRKEHVVTANKGPLVLAYQELAALAQSNGVRLLHSATVTGGLPTLNIGVRDLGVTLVNRFEGIVNSTTNYILERMGEGLSFDEALKHTQEVGMAEADASLDVDGWDAANKLVIIANAVLRQPATFKDVTVEGIRRVTQDDLRQAKERQQTIKLLALAELEGDTYHLSVRPTALDKKHPLAKIGPGMMAAIYRTDINGTIFATIEEHDPYPTAAAVLRDIVHVAISKDRS